MFRDGIFMSDNIMFNFINTVVTSLAPITYFKLRNRHNLGHLDFAKFSACNPKKGHEGLRTVGLADPNVPGEYRL